MKSPFFRFVMRGMSAVAVVLLIAGAALTWHRWGAVANTWIEHTIAAFKTQPPTPSEPDHEAHAEPHADHDHAHDEHADELEHNQTDHADHAHAAHDDATALELSPQGLRNIGLTAETIRPIQLETFRKSTTIPAIIVERPGRTRVQVATPLTGVITHVHAVQSEAVEPGTLLFRIRLTHEDLVLAQTEFLRTLGELDVELQEIKRLTEVISSGLVSEKVLLERKYARDKLTAGLQAQREALRLHGLSENQVEQIATGRRLVRELQIYAPTADDHEDDELRLVERPVQTVTYRSQMSDDSPAPPAIDTPLILQQLNVHKGQSVMAGETLCVLADYAELFIEGLAFEQDLAQLRNAMDKKWTVDARWNQSGPEPYLLRGLELAYLANQIESQSRTLHFYVRLPNELAKDQRVSGNRYVEWKYLPGQRLQLIVPVDEWPDQIVLPVDAIAREGAESFVFQKNGSHFDRVAVHVKHRDQQSAVVANDGTLVPGDVIAMRGAHQMQMALKNKSGGAVDPHAGHQH